MIKFPVALLSAALLAAPASAESVRDTHVMRWAPAGKLPFLSFHPIKQACAEAAGTEHVAGKTVPVIRQVCQKPAIVAAQKAKAQKIAAASRSTER